MGWSEKNAVGEDRILLEGMIFHGYHGTRPSERELGQPFVVDVELRLDLRSAGLSEDLTRSVDYGEVHRQAKDIVEGPAVDLTETVAERIATAILENHPPVEAIRLKVAKPHVRLDDTVLVGRRDPAPPRYRPGIEVWPGVESPPVVNNHLRSVRVLAYIMGVRPIHHVG